MYILPSNYRSSSAREANAIKDTYELSIIKKYQSSNPVRNRPVARVFKHFQHNWYVCKHHFDFCIGIYRVYKKKVIQLWSALTGSLYNLQKSFFHSQKDQAFSFWMSLFLWNLKKDWVNTIKMKIAGQNCIFSPLSVIMAANKKRNKFH